MQRRQFLLVSTIAASSGTFGVSAFAASPAKGEGWREYEITTEVNVGEKTGEARVWVPVPMAQLEGYQRTLDVKFDAPGATKVELFSVPRSDARMVAVHWKNTEAPQTVKLTTRVALRDPSVDLGAAGTARKLPASALREYLQPTSLAPLGGIVKQTSDKILAEAGHPKDAIGKARAIYEWMVVNASRDGAVAGCGTGDVTYMLNSGKISGKCADLNGLYTALLRASGVPARDVYGVRVDTSERGFKSLGKAGDISKAQHCRAQFYADGYGWIPVDPADVAKVALEEQPGGLPKDDPKVRAARAMLFGAWEGNWMAYNTAADVRFPGSELTAGFFMYPNGESANGRLDSLDPAHFAYRITSRKLA
ncbi:transglutaminase domain-containing protein [Diaphorobacter sp. HDW4A]|uniref:transglutaminase-like domain-containing protein n=1 Tax=Diaphorobacter sp. HDW4A TaxID=2714924 RepID=UPI001408A164|nr:transglutaminase-like domain-containing protein [Diaphorobacter sp. HDW4A]QIL82741.1 transglutaminase domain-containing protein [Diaphorobacter sp. HDW4A]